MGANVSNWDNYMLSTVNWRRTGNKAYEIWLCAPPVGTEVTCGLRNRYKHEITEHDRFVLSGAVGEKWVTDGKRLAQFYTFATGEEIDVQSISRKMQNGYMEWTKVRARPGQLNQYALLLPRGRYSNFPIVLPSGITAIANETGSDIGHGRGDYLVCPMGTDGLPNVSMVSLVNGLVFPYTYNLQNMRMTETEKAKVAHDVAMPNSICHLDIGVSGTFKHKAAYILRNCGVHQRDVERALDNTRFSNGNMELYATITKFQDGTELAVLVDAMRTTPRQCASYSIVRNAMGARSKAADIQSESTLLVLHREEMLIWGAGNGQLAVAMEKLIDRSRKLQEITNSGEMTIARLLVFAIKKSFDIALKKYGHSANTILKLDYINDLEVHYESGDRSLPTYIRFRWRKFTRRIRAGYVVMEPTSYNQNIRVTIATYDIPMGDSENYRDEEEYLRTVSVGWQMLNSKELASIIEQEIMEPQWD